LKRTPREEGMEEEHEMVIRKKEKEGNEYLRGRWDENGEI
jgi:hypothetical protein